jgi:general secretion pathway protein D
MGDHAKRMTLLTKISIVAVFVLFCGTFVSYDAKSTELERMTLFQFSQVVAKELDYAIIFSPRIRKNNRIGLVLSDPLPDEKLYNVFLSILNAQGYAAVRQGRIIRIVREFKARSLAN